MSLELEQAKNEIAALQRRLTEYAAEVERLKELGRDCYVDANDKSTLNALEECRQEREKLREGAKQIASAVDGVKMSITRWQQLCIIRQDGLDLLDAALAKARELRLLEKDQ